MRLALTLAERGLGRTWPNPSVGCVIVKDGAIIGRGMTAPGGRPHAETEALAMAGEAARGATAYVTLEPCCHHGQTPPCCEALIAAGVARVVVACQDHDPRVSGGGIETLRGAGIAVETGVLEAEASALNAGFFTRVHHNRPWVSLKVAATLDGRTALGNGQSQWITGDAARRYGHLLRARYDAILVGSGTVRADDPSLTCRLMGLEDRSPVRIVLDANLALSPEVSVMRTAPVTPTWIFCSHAAADGAERYTRPGCEVMAVATHADGRLVIPEMLERLAEKGITRLLVEGGAKTVTAFWQSGFADRLYWFQASSMIGADGHAAIGPMGLEAMDRLRPLRRVARVGLGNDILDILEP